MSVTEKIIEQKAQLAPAAEWWRGAVIYQIYPRSFQDSNGDGIGDLRGASDRLEHIASLGVDCIWLSPFFKSPMHDFGYDVADYCDVDPIFGTLADFDAFVAAAHGHGLKVLIDQVYSHTSDHHAWFAESRTDRTNPKADWYVWADPQEDGAPPNNWQSVFGGGAWEWDSRRRQYYFHNFLASQPDLNLHNPAVQDALLSVAQFWLDRGVDGFRLDAINFAMHDPSLRDNPPAPASRTDRTRPFDYQTHKYSMSHPQIPAFLERIRTLTNQYNGIFTVAEVGGPDPLNEMKAFTANDRHLNSAYNFSFLYADTLSNDLIKSSVREWGRADGEGWPSWAFSNHDAPRAVSRWASGDDRASAAKLYALLLMSLRGNAFLYQGEELGLPQADITFEQLQDPEAIANWPRTLGRDGARTPIPWQAGAHNAGFSSGSPWLPIGKEHLTLAADVQEQDPASVLHFMRRLIRIRKDNESLRSGDLAFVNDNDDILAFYRTTEASEVVCVFNFSDKPLTWSPPQSDAWRLLISVGITESDAICPNQLPAQSGYVALHKR